MKYASTISVTLPPPECKVYTPPQLADAMIEALEPTPHEYWLDPCIGPGAFVARLREKGISKERIVGVDIDPTSGAEDHSARIARGVDFFQWCASTNERFTRIVANPPYVAIRKLSPQLQRTVTLFGGGTEASFALRSNYWCAFLSACLRVLAHNGNLAFVLPAAWDYALYASEVRQAIHRQFQFVEVHRCLEPLFTQVREGCVVLVAKGYRGDPKTSLRLDHATSQALIVALTARRSQEAKIAHQSATTGDAYTAFSDLYAINIGCVTGDARYFLLTESERLRVELPLQAVRPVLSKARHLKAAYMTSMEWKGLFEADERVWLFNPGREVIRRKAVQAYLRYGETICDLEGYKLRHRDRWYCVPDIREGVTGYLSGMSRHGPWISFRSKRDLAATNTLYVLTAKTKMVPEERAAWALSLLSTPTRQQYEDIARRYPDGLAKLEPHDVRTLRLASPARTKGAIEKYKRAIDHLIAGRTSDAIAIADSFTRRS
jgi:adenine-specific DNA-methyltransferase